MRRPFDFFADDAAERIDADYELAKSLETLRQLEEDRAQTPLVTSVNWRDFTVMRRKAVDHAEV